MSGGLGERLAAVRDRIQAACRKAGRDPAAVGILPVSKLQPLSCLREALAAGLRDLGENRVQELAAKADALDDESPAPRWHMVGSIQTNKARLLLGCRDLVLIHSMDRPGLADALERVLAGGDRTVDCLVQVNAGGDPRKHGVPPGDVEGLVHHVERHCPHLAIRGLMTMAPLVEQGGLDRAREAFRETRRLARELALASWSRARFEVLSMGMTADLEPAVEEGSTLVRLGTALFGPRPSGG